MDVLVVAANYGTGKRSGGVSILICAVLNDRQPDDDDEPKYSSFVRVGTGLSFTDYIWVRQKKWKPWTAEDPPTFYQTSKRGQEDKGDMYIEPHDSFIVKIKAAEITTSDQYHMGMTMRFPRILSIRDDLGIEDCMTASEVLESMQVERKRKMEGSTGVSNKKRKTMTAKKASILPEYHGQDLKSVELESDVFEDMRFMVSSDPKSRTGGEDREELMKIIHANGGQCVQVMGSQPTIVVYGGTTTPYDLKLLINKGTVDIVKPEWIHDSVSRGQLAPMAKRYFFHATQERQLDPGFDQDEDVMEEDEPNADEILQSHATPASAKKQESQVKDEDNKDDDSGDWLKVSADAEDEEGSVTESETDDDSVNDDVISEGEDVDPTEAPSAGRTLDDTSWEHVVMGENDDAMQYDDTHIFKHLCFYLDSPAIARKKGMTVKTKHEEEVARSFTILASQIGDNGGRIVELDDPKLTHVVLDKRDTSRRLTLNERTSKPKRRRLVLADYISACLAEETLLDEEEFAP